MKLFYVLILFIGFIYPVDIQARTNILAKQDTIYYLVDTEKTPKLDRIFGIEYLNIPQVIQYHIYCPSYWQRQYPTFSYFLRKAPVGIALIPPTYIEAKEVKKLSYVTLKKLIELAYEEENTFNLKHATFFIEHLPDGKYIIRKVKLDSQISEH